MGAGAQKSGWAAALPAPPPPRSLLKVKPDNSATLAKANWFTSSQLASLTLFSFPEKPYDNNVSIFKKSIFFTPSSATGAYQMGGLKLMGSCLLSSNPEHLTLVTRRIVTAIRVSECFNMKGLVAHRFPSYADLRA